MGEETVKIPDIGEADDVEVIEVCISIGDIIEEGQSLIVLETDKASMEIPAPFAGKVLSICVSEGDAVVEGNTILSLETSDSPEAINNTEPDSHEHIKNPKSVQVSVEDESAEPVPVIKSESASTSASTTEQVIIPDFGDASDVEVIEVLVATGDNVAEGDSLIVLETDKASMEIPSPGAGTIESVALTAGNKVEAGDLILTMKSSTKVQATSVDDVPANEVTTTKVGASSEEKSSKFIPSLPEASSSKKELPSSRGVHAGPAVRQLARELGVDLGLVKGSGPKSRVLKDDVAAYVRDALSAQAQNASPDTSAGLPTIPEVDFSTFGEISTEKMSRIDKLTAKNMHRNWLNIPHVSQFDDVDITDLEDYRKSLKAEAEQRGVKLTPLPFILKACALALKANPKFNVSLLNDGEHKVFKHYVHIGIAVDTPAGLVVPVLRDVDQKSIWQLAEESANLANQAKSRKLAADAMKGGCFSVSSLGNIGGSGFTPIINAPEVGILGVSKLDIKPVWNGADFEPRKMLPVSLSYDHRAVNGADAGRFMATLGEMLSDIRRMTL